MQIIWHALAYIANPADRHAALYLSVTELGSLSLEDALRQLIDGGRIKEPLLDKLDSLAPGIADRTIYALVADAISAMGLFNEILVWPDGEQARANVLRLQAEVGEFMDANREAMSHGGFHGYGVQSFLAWLTVKVQGKEKNNQPDPRVLDEDAIELVTWHSCKGREWPVVAVCGMDRKIGAKLPNMNLGYSSFDDLSRLLENAQIEYSPDFAAPEIRDRFIAELDVAAEIESRRLLYVAMTRARDKLILEWPGYLAGKDNVTYWSILTQEAGLSIEDNVAKIDKSSFPCLESKGGSELPENLDLDGIPAVNTLPTLGRRAIRLEPVLTELTPDSVSPSGLKFTDLDESHLELVVERYGDGLNIDIGLTGTTLGTFLHQCFEVLGEKPELIDRLSLIAGVDIDEDITKAILSSVANFEIRMNQYFSLQSISRELHMLALDNNGSVISGIADLVIETADGLWIIDHKSDYVDDPDTVFKKYLPQLVAYANAFDREDAVILGVGINWIRRGEVMFTHI